MVNRAPPGHAGPDASTGKNSLRRACRQQCHKIERNNRGDYPCFAERLIKFVISDHQRFMVYAA